MVETIDNILILIREWPILTLLIVMFFRPVRIKVNIETNKDK